MLITIKKLLYIAVFIGICHPLCAQQKTLSFQLQNIHLQKQERVVGIEISVEAGEFVRVSGLPAGWTMTINNDPSWKTSFKGTALVGAAAKDSSSIQEMALTVSKSPFGDLKFHISGTLLVTTNFQKVERVALKGDSFKEEAPTQ